MFLSRNWAWLMWLWSKRFHVLLSLTRFGLFPSAMWWTWVWSTSCTAVSCPYKGRSTRVPKWLPFWSKPLLSSMGCASWVLAWLGGEWFLMLLYFICLQYLLPLFDMTLQSTFKKTWYTLGLLSLKWYSLNYLENTIYTYDVIWVL